MGYSWEVALGAVFLAGILFVIISVTPLRQWMLNSIPMNLRIAMGAGVGLFVGFIGLKSGGIIVQNEATFLSLGDFKNIEGYIKDADMKQGAEYVYLYNMKDKKWYYADTYKDSKLKKLF